LLLLILIQFLAYQVYHQINRKHTKTQPKNSLIFVRRFLSLMLFYYTNYAKYTNQTHYHPSPVHSIAIWASATRMRVAGTIALMRLYVPASVFASIITLKAISNLLIYVQCGLSACMAPLHRNIISLYVPHWPIWPMGYSRGQTLQGLGPAAVMAASAAITGLCPVFLFFFDFFFSLPSGPPPVRR